MVVALSSRVGAFVITKCLWGRRGRAKWPPIAGSALRDAKRAKPNAAAEVDDEAGAIGLGWANSTAETSTTATCNDPSSTRSDRTRVSG